MRSFAFVGRLPFDASCSTLKYARHVRAARPTPDARFRHVASAPVSPPRFPVVFVTLVTKKLTVFAVLEGEVVPLQDAAAKASTNTSMKPRVIGILLAEG